MKRKYKPWASGELLALKVMREAGWTNKQMANELGRTDAAVSMKITKLRKAGEWDSIPVSKQTDNEFKVERPEYVNSSHEEDCNAPVLVTIGFVSGVIFTELAKLLWSLL